MEEKKQKALTVLCILFKAKSCKINFSRPKEEARKSRREDQLATFTSTRQENVIKDHIVLLKNLHSF